METKARLIAFYLPQYHPIPENDEWWGKGFTEWTLVTRARPLFRGHQQPKLPGELGFYDLRLPEVKEAQAALAREHGVEGFCYWHYWLGNGQRLLERPFEEVLASGKPDFPFCLGWANHSWVGRFFGSDGRTLAEQQYPGAEDYRAHFDCLLRAFRDPRYITVNGCPLLYIYRWNRGNEVRKIVALWRELALQAGLKGLHVVAPAGSEASARALGTDGFTYGDSGLFSLREEHLRSASARVVRKLTGRPLVLAYEEVIARWTPCDPAALTGYPYILPNWDTTPRLGANGEVMRGGTPELFGLHVRDVLDKVTHKPRENRIVFIKSWNEWAEGNYLEPDALHGRAYLEALKGEVVT